MRSARVASIAIAVMAIAAAPASATSIQNAATGQQYTGSWGGGLMGNAVFSGSFGDVTCNQSTIGGLITDAGSGGVTATGNLNDADWRNSGGANLPCTDTIGVADHSDFQAQNLPWPGVAVWLSDNTAGTPNGTFTFDGVRIRMLFNSVIGPVNCDYFGDFNDTGASTRRLQGDLFNPDNTASGFSELRFVDEPLELVVADSDVNCDTTGEFTATYGVVGQAGTKLQIRQNPPAPPSNPPSNPPGNPPTAVPSTPAAGGTKGKRCKKAKKGASAAKRRCKKK